MEDDQSRKKPQKAIRSTQRTEIFGIPIVNKTVLARSDGKIHLTDIFPDETYELEQSALDDSDSDRSIQVPLQGIPSMQRNEQAAPERPQAAQHRNSASQSGAAHQAVAGPSEPERSRPSHSRWCDGPGTPRRSKSDHSAPHSSRQQKSGSSTPHSSRHSAGPSGARPPEPSQSHVYQNGSRSFLQPPGQPNKSASVSRSSSTQPSRQRELLGPRRGSDSALAAAQAGSKSTASGEGSRPTSQEVGEDVDASDEEGQPNVVKQPRQQATKPKNTNGLWGRANASSGKNGASKKGGGKKGKRKVSPVAENEEEPVVVKQPKQQATEPKNTNGLWGRSNASSGKNGASKKGGGKKGNKKVAPIAEEEEEEPVVVKQPKQRATNTSDRNGQRGRGNASPVKETPVKGSPTKNKKTRARRSVQMAQEQAEVTVEEPRRSSPNKKEVEHAEEEEEEAEASTEHAEQASTAGKETDRPRLSIKRKRTVSRRRTLLNPEEEASSALRPLIEPQPSTSSSRCTSRNAESDGIQELPPKKKKVPASGPRSPRRRNAQRGGATDDAELRRLYKEIKAIPTYSAPTDPDRQAENGLRRSQRTRMQHTGWFGAKYRYVKDKVADCMVEELVPYEADLDTVKETPLFNQMTREQESPKHQRKAARQPRAGRTAAAAPPSANLTPGGSGGGDDSQDPFPAEEDFDGDVSVIVNNKPMRTKLAFLVNKYRSAYDRDKGPFLVSRVLQIAEKNPIGFIKIKPGEQYPAVSTNIGSVTLCVVDGKVDVTIDDKVFNLATDQKYLGGCMIPAGTPYSIRNKNRTRDAVLFYTFSPC